MDLSRRIVGRFLDAYKRPTNMIPVWNTEQERTVYVLPETLKEEGGKYERLPANKLDSQGKPTPLHHPGQPQLPRKPKKPHKPTINRTPPPAPVNLPRQHKPRLPPKPPVPVPLIKQPKVPEPPKHHKYRQVQRYLQADTSVADRVLEKYLARLSGVGV